MFLIKCPCKSNCLHGADPTLRILQHFEHSEHSGEGGAQLDCNTSSLYSIDRTNFLKYWRSETTSTLQWIQVLQDFVFHAIRTLTHLRKTLFSNVFINKVYIVIVSYVLSLQVLCRRTWTILYHRIPKKKISVYVSSLTKLIKFLIWRSFGRRKYI